MFRDQGTSRRAVEINHVAVIPRAVEDGTFIDRRLTATQRGARGRRAPRWVAVKRANANRGRYNERRPVRGGKRADEVDAGADDVLIRKPAIVPDVARRSRGHGLPFKVVEEDGVGMRLSRNNQRQCRRESERSWAGSPPIEFSRTRRGSPPCTRSRQWAAPLVLSQWDSGESTSGGICGAEREISRAVAGVPSHG